TTHSSLLSLHDALPISRSDRSSSFTDRKSQAFLKSHRSDQIYLKGHVVTRHHHFYSFRQSDISGHIRSSQIKLRSVTIEERLVRSEEHTSELQSRFDLV